MNTNSILKKEPQDFSWCKGCGINLITIYLANFFKKTNLNYRNCSMISGIGCSGRIAGFFNLDTIHSTHGRAIPVAEGLKMANPNLNIFVVSGDGDLLGIGLSHLIHAARKNSPLKVILLNNSIYGMTGGQASAGTEKGKITVTSPSGYNFEPVKANEIVCLPYKRFFARVNPLQKDLFFTALEKSLEINEFCLIEIIYTCFENDYRRMGFKNPIDALKNRISKFKTVNKATFLKSNEFGIQTYEK